MISHANPAGFRLGNSACRVSGSAGLVDFVVVSLAENAQEQKL
jgi:hypothetical protein